MDSAKKYKLMDLIDDIKDIEAMIKVHSDDSSSIMLDQYKYKKEKFFNYNFYDEHTSSRTQFRFYKFIN